MDDQDFKTNFSIPIDRHMYVELYWEKALFQLVNQKYSI
jgi:hypothetical protein